MDINGAVIIYILTIITCSVAYVIKKTKEYLCKSLKKWLNFMKGK